MFIVRTIFRAHWINHRGEVKKSKHKINKIIELKNQSIGKRISSSPFPCRCCFYWIDTNMHEANFNLYCPNWLIFNIRDESVLNLVRGNKKFANMQIVFLFYASKPNIDMIIHMKLRIIHVKFLFFIYSQPSWQPMAFPPGAQNLISVANLDVTNKDQLSQIAHHNAQILRQIKGMHPPVTQYHNPFPMFPGPNSHKHMMVQTNKVHQHSGRFPQPQQTAEKYPTTQNLLGSSSNTAQTVFPNQSLKQNSFIGGGPQAPPFFGAKPDFNGVKYFSSFTGKVPENLMNGVSPQQNYPLFSTTSRIPLLR